MADVTAAAAGTGPVTFAEGTGTRTGNSMAVDNETFLKLLVAQLRYQDPLEPQTDTAFVTQLAQMTSLEQMQQMNLSISNMQAYDMIGKYVYAEVLDERTGILNGYLGLVSSVVFREGMPHVVIEDNAVPASKVTRVFDASVFAPAPSPDAGTDWDTDPG
ncbi:MAG: hypothetical protein GX585_02870 [Clostridiales bacterium]|nr:hypothetical protein [Clostridiales bacterium]